jgi:putative phage-type endonuclease
MTPEEWHQWRGEGWGASDIAAAWTGRYGGAYKVVATKAGRLEPEFDEDTTDRMQRGKDLEAAIATMVGVATGWYVVGEQTCCENPDNPRHRATVDGFVSVHPVAPLADSVGPVEIKTHGVEVRPAWDYYEAQVQWQLHVTGFDRAVLAVAAVDDSTGQIVGFRFSVVGVDRLLQASLIALAEEMEEHLRAGTLPAPDGSDATTKAVRAVTWAVDEGAETVDLSDLAEAVERYTEVKAAVVAAKEEQAELENILRDRIGVASKGVAGEWVVTYSKPRRVLNEDRVLDEFPQLAKSVLDREAADEALGKALDAYREPIGARSLTVRKAKP